jgi:hypothetical protein
MSTGYDVPVLPGDDGYLRDVEDRIMPFRPTLPVLNVRIPQPFVVCTRMKGIGGQSAVAPMLLRVLRTGYLLRERRLNGREATDLDRSLMTQRRYRDDEVREIFERASHRDASVMTVRPIADGLTLGELQDIGREVGLKATTVAEAAAALEMRTSLPPQKRSLGMPIEVGRTVALPRPLTDSEWEHLVGELRTTFGARGRVSSQGGLREWVNGNLHACIEPAVVGYRLRLGTHKGDAATVNALGATGVVTGAIVFGALLMSGGIQEAVFVPWMISASGVAAVFANAIRLPRWRRQREEQMNHIAAIVTAIMDRPLTSADTTLQAAEKPEHGG